MKEGWLGCLHGQAWMVLLLCFHLSALCRTEESHASVGVLHLSVSHLLFALASTSVCLCVQQPGRNKSPRKAQSFIYSSTLRASFAAVFVSDTSTDSRAHSKVDWPLVLAEHRQQEKRTNARVPPSLLFFQSRTRTTQQEVGR